MSDCLHCDINQLVQQRLERSNTDLGEVASMLVESLTDLILLAPEDERPNLMAYALSGFGQVFSEKSGGDGRRLQCHTLNRVWFESGSSPLGWIGREDSHLITLHRRGSGLVLRVDCARWGQTPEDLRHLALSAPHARTRERALALFDITQHRCATQVAVRTGRRAHTGDGVGARL